ncbi:hypothetical protein H6G17_00825 [Chroococcidiopsis sp. FACHB-1243]|nr:hypothetical protein [Chroococcidiopsis sp. [FACHB-1243]]MBD2304065.1 hypothetical protein [Chroococcidiopsis sp. [FACHB-1243]]
MHSCAPLPVLYARSRIAVDKNNAIATFALLYTLASILNRRQVIFLAISL